MGGDVGGSSTTATVTGIQNHPVASTTPTNGQGLVYSTGTNTWGPGAVSATMGGDLSGASSTATVAGIQNHPVAATAPTDGQTLIYSASAGNWQPGTVSATMGGDVTGSSSSTTVTAIQNRPVSSTAPTNGQSLMYSPSTNTWGPGNPATTMGGDVSGASGASTVTGIQNHPVAATAPTNGQVLVYASNTWAPGAVTAPMAGDVGGTSAASTVTGIQNHPVASSAPTDGQTLIYNAAAAAWAPAPVTTNTTAVGGDLGGSSSSATVTGIQSRPVAATAPLSNQVLTWNATTSQWTPSNPTIAEGFSLVQNSSTTASLNAECSSTSPCSVRFGSAAQQYTGPNNITITASSGTGQLLVYADNSGSIQVVHNLTNVTCDGQCVATNTSTPAFPLGSIPLWSCSVVVGAWGGACLDFRAPLSTLRIVPGPGLFAVETPDQIVIGVDGQSFSFSNSVAEAAAMTTAGNLENGACAQRGSMRIPGAAPGSIVLAGWGSLPAGVTGSLRVSTANTADILLCNASGATQALAAVKVIARLPQSAAPAVSAQAGSRVKLHFTSADLASNPTLEYCYGNENCTQGASLGSIPLTICKGSCDVILGGVVGALRYHLRDRNAIVARNDDWREVRVDSVR
jgi:hypothetical protein